MDDSESILISCKKVVSGLPGEDDSFDLDLLMFINSTLAILTQIRIGPPEGLIVKDASTAWSDFSDNMLVPAYVSMKVRYQFDPPVTTAVKEALIANISELEWRLGVSEDDTNTSGDENAE